MPPRLVRREGDIGFFEPEGGGEPRAVHLPSAPTFRALADAAEQTPQLQATPLQVPIYGSQPQPPGRPAPAPRRAARPAPQPQQPPLDPDAQRALQSFQRPAPPPVEAVEAPRLRMETGLARPNAPVIAGDMSRSHADLDQRGALALQQDPTIEEDLLTMDRYAQSFGEPGEARPGETFVDADGNVIEAPGALDNPWANLGAQQQAPTTTRPTPAPGSRPRPRAPRPPTEEELNAQLISELTGRPRDDAPLVGEDFRTQSFGEREQELIGDSERLAQDRAHQAGVTAAEQQDAIEEAQMQAAQTERDRQDSTRAAMQRYQAAQQRLSEAQIDPNRFFADRGGAAGRIGGAIAVALGAVGATLTGGPNTALEIISDEIDRDIEAQRANQSLASAEVDSARTFVDLTRTEFSDRQAADEAARSFAWETVARRAAQHEAELQGQDARMQAQALRLEAEQRAAMHAQQAQEAEFRRELELRTLQANTIRAEARATREQRRAMGGGGNRLRPATAQQLEVYDDLRQRGLSEEDAARGAGMSFVPGQNQGGPAAEFGVPGATWIGGAEPNAVDVTRARTITGSTNAARAAIDQLIELREEYGPEVLNRDVVARVNQLRSQVITALRTIEQTGVPSEFEMEDFRSRVPDATAFSFDVLPNLRALRGALQTTADAWLQPLGYAYGENRMIDTPEGVEIVESE
jgi:hypothetical protein